MRPYAFGRIDLGRVGGEVEDVKARVFSDEIHDGFALVYRMVVPDHDDLATDRFQKRTQECENFLAGEVLPVKSTEQTSPPAAWRYDQRGNGVDPAMVRNLGSNDWRFPARCPSALERRNQRESAFILEDQRRSQGAALFLSPASHSASNALLLHRLAALPVAWASDYSILCAASSAKLHSGDTERRTNPISGARSDQASSNLLHIPVQMPRASRPLPCAPLASRSNVGAYRTSCERVLRRRAHLCATAQQCVCSRQFDRQPQRTTDPAQAASFHAQFVHQPGRSCLASACRRVWHGRQKFVKSQ